MKWDRYGKDIIERAGLEGEDIRLIENEDEIDGSVKDALMKGERLFIAAGGDGTFNRMISAIMGVEAEDRKDVVLGAIGMGSSNDLHKPFSKERVFEGIPYRLDRDRSRMANIIQITSTDPDGNRNIDYSAVNSSCGVISEGNLLFNRPRGLTRPLKRLWTPLGIYSAAVIGLIEFIPFDCRMIIDGKEMRTSITTLSVLLSPHFTGDLVYDTPVDPYMDHFLVNLSERMGVLGRFGLLIGIAYGNFKDRKKCHSWKARDLEIVPERDIPIEYDGEVRIVSKAEFRLIEGGIRICG